MLEVLAKATAQIRLRYVNGSDRINTSCASSVYNVTCKFHLRETKQNKTYGNIAPDLLVSARVLAGNKCPLIKVN